MPLSANLLQFVRDHRDEPTLSVYVEGVPADPGSRRAWRVRLRQGLQEARAELESAPEKEQRAFDECEADLLQRLPENALTPSPTGWGYFRTAGGDTLALTIASGAVETSVRWGPGPSVIPFLRVAAPEHALVIRIDLAHAELSAWNEGTLQLLDRLEADPPHDVDKKMGSTPRQGFHAGTRGTPRTDEAQRQRTDGQQRLREDTLQSLRSRDDGKTSIVLGGVARASARFLAELPAAVASRAIVAPGLTMRTTSARMTTAIHAALAALRRTQCEARLSTLLEARPMDRAARGFEPVEAAAAADAIDALHFSERAWRRDPERIELIVQRAICGGADVECAAFTEQSGLDGTAEGLIATLRFPVPDLERVTVTQET